MDSKIIHAACMRVAITVIAIGVAIIERERNRIYIPREPRIMQLLNENSILTAF